MRFVPVAQFWFLVTRLLNWIQSFTYWKELVKVRSDNETLSRKLLQAQKKCEELGELNKALESGISDRDGELDELYEQFIRKVDEVVEQKQKTAKLQEELAERDAWENAVVQKGFNELSDEIHSLETKVQCLEVALEEKEETVRACEDEKYAIESKVQCLKVALEEKEEALVSYRKEMRELRDDRDRCFLHLLDVHDGVCRRKKLCTFVNDNADASPSNDQTEDFAAAEATLRNAGEALSNLVSMARRVKVMAKCPPQSHGSLGDMAEVVSEPSECECVIGTEIGSASTGTLAVTQ